MVRKKNPVNSVKLSQKNKIYLQRLGFIDGRSGRTRPEMNFNKFMNECITVVCEGGMHIRTSNPATNDDLVRAWSKYQVGLRSREIMRLQDEIIQIAKQRPQKKAYEEAQKITMEFGDPEIII